MATIVAAAGGGNWQTNATWVGGVKPTAADNVQLTGTSGNVTIDSGAVCRSLDCTGYTGTLTHTADVTLSIGDATAGTGNIALKFVAGMTYTVDSGGLGNANLNFISTSATQQTLTFAGKVPHVVRFGGAGGSWLFNDDLTTTSTGSLITVTGTVNTNGKTLNVGSLGNNTGNTLTLTFGASTITAKNVNITSTGLTLTANTTNITLTGGWTLSNNSFAAKTWNNLTITGTNLYIDDANTFANLTITGSAIRNHTVSFNASQTVTGTLTINGNSSINRILINSHVAGTAHTLTAATVSVTNADFQDTTGAGAGSWNLAAITGLSGDCGGNSGITFTTAAAQTHTSSAGGNWSDSSKWTSRVPLPQDDVTVDVNTTGTLTADMARLGKAVNFTGFVGTLDCSSNSNSIFGSLTLGSGMTISGTQTLSLSGRASSNITSNSAQFSQSVSIDGTYTLQDNFSAIGTLTVLANGSFSANTFNTSVSTFIHSGSFATTTLSTGILSLQATSGTVFTRIFGGTFSAASATLTIASSSSSSRTISVFSDTIGTLDYTVAGSTGALVINSSLTLTTVNVSDGKTLSLHNGGTLTVTTFNVNGSNGTNTTLNTDSAGSSADLSIASGTTTVSYLTIKDIHALGGATFRALHSTDVSGNTGWLFVPDSSDLILNPIADNTINSWTTDTGGTTNLYQAIDEGTASDTDYIQSPAGPTSSSYYETNLENHLDVHKSTGHIVHYRYQKNVSGGAIDLTAELRQGASTSIASWAHTGISNAWTTQNQTLTGGQADSITDYSDLRIRFTPNMTTTDQVPTYIADRATANSNSTVTTVDLVLSGLTVGNYLIVRTAADNSGGGGAAQSFTVTNQSGSAMGTHTEYQQNNDPGSASAGVTLNVSVIKIAATSGTIRLTYGGSVVQACVAEEWSGIDGTTPVVGTPVKANGVNSTSLASMTDTSIAAGNVAYGIEAVEGPSSDTYTQDADTTNGSWSTVTKLGTSNATADTNMTTYGGYKAVTAAGAQTYNPTINNARDSAGIILELAAAAATIKTQVSWANFEIPAASARRSGLSTGVDSGFAIF